MSMDRVYEIHNKTPQGKLFECFRRNGASDLFLMTMMHAPAAGHFNEFFINAVDEFITFKKEKRTPELFCTIEEKYYQEEFAKDPHCGSIYMAIGYPGNFDLGFVGAINEFNNCLV